MRIRRSPKKIYSHALPADDKRAADEWDQIVGPLQ